MSEPLSSGGMPRTARSSTSFVASFAHWMLWSHNTDRSWCTPRNRGQDLRHKLSKIVDAVAAGTNQNNRDRVHCEVLLKLEVLVHRDEDVKLSGGLSQQRAVLESRPTDADDSLRVHA